jgi:hypothetical protein
MVVTCPIFPAGKVNAFLPKMLCAKRNHMRLKKARQLRQGVGQQRSRRICGSSISLSLLSHAQKSGQLGRSLERGKRGRNRSGKAMQGTIPLCGTYLEKSRQTVEGNFQGF